MEQCILTALHSVSKQRSEECYFPIEQWTPLEWSAAVAGEAGELCNTIKKYQQGDARFSVSDIASEAADVIIYLDLLSHKLGFDLVEAIREKFNRRSAELSSLHLIHTTDRIGDIMELPF